MKNLKKKVNGITLIALVVTIIVLLILAGIAINLTIGNNGLFSRAIQARQKNKYSQDIEMIEMAMTVADFDWYIGEYQEDEDVFLAELRKTDENAEVEYKEYEAIVYYNQDYYTVDTITREIKKQEEIKVYVAMIGEIKYKTIQEAFDAVPKNNIETEVKLLANVSGEITVIEEEKNIVLNMDGFTTAISVENKGKLKIKNGIFSGNRRVGEGKITNNGELDLEDMQEINYSIYNQNTLNIKSIEKGAGNIENYGTVNISNYKSEEDYGIIYNYNYFTNNGIMNISDSQIYGAEIKNENRLNIKDSELEQLLAGAKMIKNNGYCEVSGNSTLKNAGNQAAITNEVEAEFIMSGGCLVAQRAIENSGNVLLKGNMTGNTGWGTPSDIYIQNAKNGKIEIQENAYLTMSNGLAIIENKGGIIEVTGGKLEGKGNITRAITNYENGTVIIGEDAIIIPEYIEE